MEEWKVITKPKIQMITQADYIRKEIAYLKREQVIPNKYSFAERIGRYVRIKLLQHKLNTGIYEKEIFQKKEEVQPKTEDNFNENEQGRNKTVNEMF